MPSAQVNTINCLILQSKTPLKHLPSHFQVYFINSKRRFFLYFKFHKQMIQAIQIFSDNNIRFYRRESLLPDREEHEEQIYHCSYRYKKIDLRRYLLSTTPYNQPKMHFDKYEKAKSQYESLKNNQPQQKILPIAQPILVAQQKIVAKQQPPFNGYKFKNEGVISILQNKELVNQILLSLNLMK